MKALLIIDMLIDFISPDGALYIGPVADEVLPAVNERLDKHRSEGNLIIYLCDNHMEDDREFEMFPPHGLSDSGGEEIVADLIPSGDERVIHKRRFSSFLGTDLDITLREKGITEIELAGVVTNICVLYTAADARGLNYNVEVHKNAVASFDQDAHRFALQEMENTLGVTLI